MTTRKSNSMKDWQSIKSVFLRLYLEDNKTLDEVRSKLAEEYNFVASEKAFKGHITRWQAFKNYKASKKEELAQYQDSFEQAGRNTSALIIRGQPVKWNRVDRDKKAKDVPKCRKRQLQPLDGVKTIPSRIEMVSLRIPSSIPDPDELLLHTAKNYYQYELSFWVASPQDVWRLPIYYTYNKLKHALNFLAVRSHTHHGWELVNQACHDLQACNRTKTFEILHILLEFVNLPVWRNHTMLEDEIFKYVADLILHKLPADNPFRSFLLQVTTLGNLRRIASRITLLEHNMLVQHANAFPWDIRFELMMDSIYDIIQCGYHSEAQVYLDGLLHLTNLTLTWRVKSLRMMTFAHGVAGDFNSAIAKGSQCVLVTEEPLRVIGSQLISIDLMQDVASVHKILPFSFMLKGDWSSSIAKTISWES